MYLLFDSKLVSKKKIRCRKRQADPVFDEAVHFMANENEKVALALKQVSTGGPIVQPGAPGIMTFQESSTSRPISSTARPITGVSNSLESTRSDTGLHKATSQQIMNSQSRSLSRTSLSKSDVSKSNLSNSRQSSIEFPGSTASLCNINTSNSCALQICICGDYSRLNRKTLLGCIKIDLKQVQIRKSAIRSKYCIFAANLL